VSNCFPLLIFVVLIVIFLVLVILVFHPRHRPSKSSSSSSSSSYLVILDSSSDSSSFSRRDHGADVGIRTRRLSSLVDRPEECLAQSRVNVRLGQGQIERCAGGMAQVGVLAQSLQKINEVRHAIISWGVVRRKRHSKRKSFFGLRHYVLQANK